jgi:hypothetical protein
MVSFAYSDFVDFKTSNGLMELSTGPYISYSRYNFMITNT